jgi:ribonuclease G
VERQLENAFRRKVWLKSGGYLIFDETEALVAIDVNTGRHKGGKTQEDSILQVNTEAAQEVARQLRLRNIGGLVVIDFIDMKSRKNQTTVYKTLKDALQNDKARTNVLPVSQLGLIEMTRQRMEESLRAANYSPTVRTATGGARCSRT